MGTNLGEELTKEIAGAKAAYAEKTSEFKALIEQQNEEIKRYGTTTSETAAKISEVEQKYDQTLADLQGKVEEASEKYQEVKTYLEELEAKGAKRGGSDEYKSIDEIFETEEGKNFLGWDPSKGQVASPILTVKQFSRLISRQQRKAITGAADIRDVLSANLVQVIKGSPKLRTQHVRDHMTVIQSPGTGKVDYVEETGYTNNADFQNGDGATKPTSDLEYEKKTGNAATIAHGIPISRQLARHAPALMSRIESRLINGLYQKEDTAILFADGNNGAYTGIANTEGVLDFGTDHPNPYQTDDTYGDTIRRAFTLVQAREMLPNLVIVNPYDAEAIDLTKDAEKRYLNIPMIGPDGMPVIWRLPMFVSTAMTQGSFMLGDFANAATLWETDMANIQMFTQHSDYAIKNMVLLLAEMEEILTVEIPEGFVSGTFSEGS